MKIAVVGATGLVGKVILQQLEKAQFEIDQIFPVASTRSVGKELTFKGFKNLYILFINTLINGIFYCL